VYAEAGSKVYAWAGSKVYAWAGSKVYAKVGSTVYAEVNLYTANEVDYDLRWFGDSLESLRFIAGCSDMLTKDEALLRWSKTQRGDEREDDRAILFTLLINDIMEMVK
jgi:hypothetical protein